MKILKLIFVLMLLMCYSEAQTPLRVTYRLLKEFMLRMTGRSISEPRLLKRAEDNNKLQKRIQDSVDFPCSGDVLDFRSKERPTSVHELRPGDIDVIGAMGDSLTAGTGAGALNLLQVTTENRGVSWSIGGEGTWREFITLPNILKVFNPNLFGYSLRDSFGHNPAAQFNAAEIGAMSQDLPYMARQLVRRMKDDPRVNIEKDWKIVTVMIGANDFCLDICYHDNPMEVLDIHRKEIRESLMTLKENLPRTLVNLVPAPDVTVLKSFKNKPLACRLTHLIECPCFFGQPQKWKRPMIRDILYKWRYIDIEMADLPEFNDSENFTIVIQPFTMNITFPKDEIGGTDYSHLSTDCFHFSQKGYARAANALWNNMMEPEGKKTYDWDDVFKKLLCPTKESPYIYTRLNSNRTPKTSSNENSYDNNLFKRSIKNT